MAKMKSKKKGLSDMKNEANTSKKKPTNRFEVHVNRQKFSILGRTMKTDRGLPYVARANAIKRRKETLLQEYKVGNKSNKFLDRRIGEFNKNMTAEDKIIARFAAERSSSHRKKALFNLADDEPLTHKGRSIMELEAFDDPNSDDDDDFLDRNLDGKFVEEAHFGGGMLKKSDGSRMAVIDQLIAESKQRKAEKAAIKEQTCAATERLDSQWRDLLPVMGAGYNNDFEDIKKDDYDKILGQLKFEPRGTPSDRLKSETEVAEAEANRLREMEEDRLQRMNGPPNLNSKTSSKKHRSADDLDDGFYLSSDEDDSGVLTYGADGKPVDPLKGKTKSVSELEIANDGLEDENDEGADTNSNDSDDDDESEDDYSDLKLELENESIDEESSDETHHTNLNVSNRSQDLGEKPASHLGSDKVVSRSKTEKRKSSEMSEELNHSQNDLTVEDSNSLKLPKRKKVSFNTDVQETIYEKPQDVPICPTNLDDVARNAEVLRDKSCRDLPYVFSIPDTYEEFETLIKDKSLLQQTVIVERMIKCSHPSLKEGNRSRLELLFTFILQRLNDTDFSETWMALDAFAPYLFDLTQFFPSHAANCLCEVLSEKFDAYLRRKTHYPYPDTLVFLKLVPLLFPPSDKRHQVTTPAIIFILSMLTTCRPNTRRGIACGLFLCALLTQYVSLSKRIAPEAISYLNGILQMASIKMDLKQNKLVGPFLTEYKFLCLSGDLSQYEGSCKMSLVELGIKGSTVDNEFRIRALFSALTTLETFSSYYQDKPGIYLLFEPVHLNLQSLAFDMYPALVSYKVLEVTKTMEELKGKPLTPLVKEAPKPKSLRMYEPNIKPVFDKNKIKDEMIRLKRRVKKEAKGALREIRKDRTFIAGVRFKEQKASDAVRMQKVKEIYGWGSQQQGELNKMDRIKRRKKFKR